MCGVVVGGSEVQRFMWKWKEPLFDAVVTFERQPGKGERAAGLLSAATAQSQPRSTCWAKADDEAEDIADPSSKIMIMFHLM
jgi:hypothetical protein